MNKIDKIYELRDGSGMAFSAATAPSVAAKPLFPHKRVHKWRCNFHDFSSDFSIISLF
jgi:hypothetical protein